MNEKRSPINTEEEVRRNPSAFLGLGIMMGGSGAILHQEAQGQRYTLPTQVSAGGKEALEKSGVKFLAAVDGNPMFQYVELPAGWQKKATDHSMHSDLLDEKGRKRAGIFYKAAFYDRCAHLSVNCRYNFRRDYANAGAGVAIVLDAGEPIYTTEPISAEGGRSWEAGDKADAMAKAWLDANYPFWRDASMYWE